MIGFTLPGPSREINIKWKAISSSQAIIEFKMDGTILNANANFLKAVGISGIYRKMFKP